MAPKLLIIGKFKVPPSVPKDYETDAWNCLSGAVHSIQSHTLIPDSLESLYKHCENLCHHGQGATLYDRLTSLCRAHSSSTASLLKFQLREPHSSLQAINSAWSQHCREMIMIRSIFLYLDRTHVKSASLKSLWDMGLELFRDCVLKDTNVKQKLISSLMALIHASRSGEQVDTLLLQSVLKMLQDLAIYMVTFEGYFLESTVSFYRDWSSSYMFEIESASDGGSAVSNYLGLVIEKLEWELSHVDPVDGYLDPGTKRPLATVLEDELIRAHVPLLLEKGFKSFISNERIPDLQRLYALLERVHRLSDLKKEFSNYIKETGSVIVMDKNRDKEMVTDLISLKCRMDLVLSQVFTSSDTFLHALNESFENFMNQRPNKPAELIAKHVDSILRNSKLSEEQMQEALDQCLALFRLCQGKDIFEAFYSRDLAKRLLLSKSASEDAEKSFLSNLKTECGAGFTSKLEGMFKDMDLSKDIMSSFKQSKYANQITMDLSVNVLTAGLWPSYPTLGLNLPPDFATCESVFCEFYTSKHNGRRLTWQNGLGHCVLKASFEKGSKELNVSLPQAVVLFQFNGHDTLTFGELLTATGIETKECARVLQSLSCGKVRVITKSPKSKDVSVSDSFSFNESFENPLFRIKINAIQSKETIQEQVSTNERVFQDRHYQVDAAIVRIMKTRKVCAHSALKSELFEMLKFPVAGPDLKKRIESLIERDYMKRDESDPNTYIYVA